MVFVFRNYLLNALPFSDKSSNIDFITGASNKNKVCF